MPFILAELTTMRFAFTSTDYDQSSLMQHLMG